MPRPRNWPKQFVTNFDKYKEGASPEIMAAAPKSAVKA